MARFRLVDVDDNENIIKEHYCSEMFPGDSKNRGNLIKIMNIVYIILQKNYI